MVIIDGQITSGTKSAHNNIPKQIPHIEKEFPEVKDCKHATINVILDCQIEIIAPDYVTTPIKWDSGRREMFGFVRVGFEVVGGTGVIDAWIYIPYNSDHRMNPYVVEILTTPIDLEGAKECRIYVRRTKKSKLIL